MADYNHHYKNYGDRKLEIVNGKEFSANQTYIAAMQARQSSESFPPPPLPVSSRVKSKSSAVKPWGFNDPEMKRKRRVASYKVYAVEGKVKASFRKSVRWIKDKCSGFVHGW